MSSRTAAVRGDIARYVVLTLGAAVMVMPFLYMLSTSFKGQQYVLSFPPQFIPHGASFENYSRVWSTQGFAHYFANSIKVAVASTALSLMVPAMMLIVPQFVLAKDLGLINSLTGLVIFYAGSTLALNTFLLRGFFQGIPKELEEAMEVDGAGAFARYWRLILPLSRPVLATCTIFTFLASWDEFSWALTTIDDPHKRTLPIAIALFQGQNSTLWGLVFAASIIAVLPVIAIFLIFQRHFVSGLTSGAVKG